MKIFPDTSFSRDNLDREDFFTIEVVFPIPILTLPHEFE
jgi:hypothetical protein